VEHRYAAAAFQEDAVRSHRLVALSCAAVLGSGSIHAQDPSAMSARTFTSKQGDLPYRLFTPEGAGKEKLQPLVLFLHGAGERGSDNARQLRHGVRAFLEPQNQQKRPCFVAAPQCPAGTRWNVDQLAAFAEAMAALPGVDKSRVYLTGLSLGGYATWHLAGRRPGLFAAAIPVCGGGLTGDAERLATLPIWAFHGDADPTVSVEESRKMIAAIRKAGGQPQYTEYPGVDHDSWTRTYADPHVHEWLFAQRRPIPLHEGDRVVFLGDSITEAGAADGGYIRLLEQQLAATKAELIGAGISGNKVPDLQRRLERDVLARKPTLVVIYIGINDVWHSERNEGTPREAFATGLRGLVDRITAAGARVILCTPSVIGEKASGTNKLDAMLEEYAETTRKVAADASVQLIDLRRAFVDRLRASNADDKSSGVFTSDGVHLNGAGNRLVADCMLRALGAGDTVPR
jgi:lysophospholipase L1-like esterase/dienelactone hydrolase